MHKKWIIIFLLLLLPCLIFAETVEVIGTDGKKKELQFSEDTKQINLAKTVYSIAEIKGLHRLPNLRILKISFADLSNTDFSFLQELHELEVLVLTYTTIKDFDFLSEAPQLKVFSCRETMKIESNIETISLKHNPNLVFFEIHEASLDTIPVLNNIPTTLKLISFHGTDFQNLDSESLSRLESMSVGFFFNASVAKQIDNLTESLVILPNSILSCIYEIYIPY